ncbi:MAG: N-acetyl-gamma-glutamyl-phosphate reductase [Canidatus Methanoxibalbensis ujae]|nr:N-acetyl-gamma-glutamyl-phosphate reductase [Candidatus Methanoxibalbensis ujae]
MAMIRVGVIGGSGYTGTELLRLLLTHPAVEITVVTSRRHKGKKVHDVNTHLRPFADIEYEDVAVKEIARRCDVVFTAVPHGVSMKYVPELLENGVRVIDLSADYRLKCEEYERIYGKHEDEAFRRGEREAVYGLTEIHPEVSSAVLVANPGCYPTGAILAVAPIVHEFDVCCTVIDAKSGISGGGSEPSARSHFPNLAENIIPYDVTTHRHTAEIRQEILRYRDVRVHFTPHVIPTIRGILTTAHVFIRGHADREDIREAYEHFYADCKFIRILNDVPSLRDVRGTNFCDIWFDVEEAGGDEVRAVVISAIDNLVKGGAGQAIQNMNLMFKMPEEEGLWFPGIVP